MRHKDPVSATARPASVLLACGLAAPVAAASLAFAAPASADVDTDFADQLHTYGIYGPRDYNAWIAKITCERLDHGVDPDAYTSARFVSHNLPRGTSTAQAWQFLGAAVSTYCPDLTPALQQAVERHR